MNNTLSDYIKKRDEKFDEEFPKFSGVGSPYPVFENVNRDYVKSHINETIKGVVEKIHEEMADLVERKGAKSVSPRDFFALLQNTLKELNEKE